MPDRECHPQVAAAVRDALAQTADAPAFRSLLTALMARPGRVLAPHGLAKWPAFVLDSCRALAGDPAAAVSAAAAVEFAVAAIDVLDDVIDDEWGAALARPARAPNAGLALSWLAQCCLGRLAERLGAERARLVGDLLARGCLASCAGQDVDLELEAAPEVSEELALEATRRKSGSLAAMACQVGGAVATDDPAILAALGVFGGHAGVVAQLLNDLAGVAPGAPDRGSDLRRRKKTLPVAYALCCAREERLAAVLAPYRHAAPLSAGEEEDLARALGELGARHYTWVVAAAHRREALAALRALARATGRGEVRRLRHLVPPVRLRQAG